MTREDLIRSQASQLGFDACRFTTADPPASGPRFSDWLARECHGAMTWLARNADKRLDPQRVLPGAKSIVMLHAAYAGPTVAREQGNSGSLGSASGFDGGESGREGISQAPLTGNIASYACHADYHDLLSSRLKALAEHIDQTGGPETRSLWYTDTGPLLERDLAQRAGLGFIGKHTNLVSRTHGNWVLLAEILTTLELAPDPPEKNRCGSCVRCLNACPTQAITAPFRLDARRCISYLTIELKGAIPEELRPAMGRRVFGCDDCLAACPWNRFARAGAMMRQHRRADLDQPHLLSLLALDDAGFKARFAGTPALRTKRRGLLRNVCVALGNVGNEDALPALAKAAGDPEPLVAEHARWALGRIESRS